MLKNIREITLFEEILDSGSSLRVKVTGRSMAPFLRGGEIVTLKKEPHDALRRGDLIFFKNSRGAPLLHRVIQKITSSDEKIFFRTKGDALIALDEPIQHHRVLGKVSRIEKIDSGSGSKCINMESFRWRTINAIIARISLFRSYGYYALFRLKGFLIVSCGLMKEKMESFRG